MTTFHQIEIIKSFPISTGLALIEANERRQELNADIEAFLAKGGKVTVIQQPAVAPKKPVEQITTFTQRAKWPNRLAYVALMEKHKITVLQLSSILNTSKITLARYLNGTSDPFVDTRQRLERAIDFLIAKKLKEQES